MLLIYTPLTLELITNPCLSSALITTTPEHLNLTKSIFIALLISFFLLEFNRISFKIFNSIKSSWLSAIPTTAGGAATGCHSFPAPELWPDSPSTGTSQAHASPQGLSVQQTWRTPCRREHRSVGRAGRRMSRTPLPQELALPPPWRWHSAGQHHAAHLC